MNRPFSSILGIDAMSPVARRGFLALGVAGAGAFLAPALATAAAHRVVFDDR
jgi:hypothetical protein